MYIKIVFYLLEYVSNKNTNITRCVRMLFFIWPHDKYNILCLCHLLLTIVISVERRAPHSILTLVLRPTSLNKFLKYKIQIDNCENLSPIKYWNMPGFDLFLNDFAFSPVSGSFPYLLTAISMRMVSRLLTK